MVSKSKKRSHDGRYASELQRKKSVGQTIDYQDFVPTKKRRHDRPLTTNSTTDNAEMFSILDFILEPPEIDLDFEGNFAAEEDSQTDVVYTSPELLPDLDAADDSFDFNGLETSSQNLEAMETGESEETAFDSGLTDNNRETNDRIQPPSEEQEEPSDFAVADSDGAYTGDSIQFRFDIPEPPLPGYETVINSSDSWIWRIIILLTTWAHVSFHVPKRVLEVIMKVLKGIFTAIRQMEGVQEAPITLKTAFKSLGLEDNFVVFPMCVTCRRIYSKDDLSEDFLCTYCDKELFNETGKTKKKARKRTPCLQFPFRPVSSQLSEFLNREGIEDALDSWRQRTSDDTLRDMMDGHIWKELKGHDGKPFFNTDPNREDKHELRIGITLGFDGYVQLKTNHGLQTDIFFKDLGMNEVETLVHIALVYYRVA